MNKGKKKKAAKVKSTPKRKRLKKSERADLIGWIKTSLSFNQPTSVMVTEIRNRYGISERHAYRYLREANAAIKTQGNAEVSEMLGEVMNDLETAKLKALREGDTGSFLKVVDRKIKVIEIKQKGGGHVDRQASTVEGAQSNILGKAMEILRGDGRTLE